jgi:hypothetical protein
MNRPGPLVGLLSGVDHTSLESQPFANARLKKADTLVVARDNDRLRT